MNTTTNSLPITFWLIAGIALLWNLMGGFAFYTDITITQEAISLLPLEQQARYLDNPIWMKIMYGIATIGGIIASIGLLMRKAWSEKLFLVSLIAVLVQMGSVVFTMMGEMTMKDMMLPLMVILIAMFLWYYSKKSIARGWIS